MTTAATTGSGILGTVPTTTPTTPPVPAGADKATFLQLLVAQLKNQNPENPSDGAAFVTQLAQFTALEQSTQMTQDIAAIRTLLTAQNAASPKGA
jgi:flagellar basal-body rod modification protein FlgD